MPAVWGLLIVAVGVSLLLVAAHGARGLALTDAPQIAPASAASGTDSTH